MRIKKDALDEFELQFVIRIPSYCLLVYYLKNHKQYRRLQISDLLYDYPMECLIPRKKYLRTSIGK